VKPLAELDARGVRALLFDLDDTLSTAGRITAQAYGALERLHAAGTRTVAVTGRPAGWCDHVARMWPVDAVVGENGAFYFRHAGGRLRREYQEAPELRARHRERLAQGRSSPPSPDARSPRIRRTGRRTSPSTIARTSRPCRSARPSASPP